MIDKVKLIISTPFRELINSEKVLIFLDVYSKLYLFGSQPGGCERCLKNYYEQIIKNGMEKANEYEAAKNRTCKPAWNSLFYMQRLGKHVNSEFLTDAQAIQYLSTGDLKESQFTKLPDGWAQPEAPKPQSVKSVQKRTKK